MKTFTVTPPSPSERMVPAEGSLFFVTVSNIRGIIPSRLAEVEEGKSFHLKAAYDVHGHPMSLELTVNQIIHPGPLSGDCTKLLLTKRLSGKLFGTVAIGMFMAAAPEEIHESF